MSKISTTTSLKTLRETLCVAQGIVNRSSESRAHGDRLQLLINDIDAQRPLGSNGRHGNLHTLRCQCDVPWWRKLLGHEVGGSLP